MANGKEIRISITSALNAAGIEATKTQVEQMSKSVKKSLGDMAAQNRRHMADIKAGWDWAVSGIKAAWRGLQAVIQAAFSFETTTAQFKTLIGDIDAAREHMADLKALGDTPPFSLDEFAKASRSLMVLTDGALGYKRSLQMIGDAAAATGQPVEEMGQAVGRLYATIRDGQPISRAATALRNMGVLTPEVVASLNELQQSGATNAEIWAEVEKQFGRFQGAMEETEKTGNGLIGAIQSRWNNILREFGMAVADDAKTQLSALADAAKNLEESGNIEVWASKAVSWFARFAEGAKAVLGPLAKITELSMKILQTPYETMGSAIGEMFGTATNGGSLKDIISAGVNGAKGGFNDVWDTDGAQAAEDEAKREEAAKKRAEAVAEAEAKEQERAAQEQKRIQDQLAEAQEKADKKAAEKKAEAEKKAAEKRAEEERKAAEKAAAERARLDAQEAARRERERQKELADKIRDHQKLLAAERSEESKTRSAVSAAESKLQRAWGWYRDKGSMAAQLEEEKADAAAQKQFEKDFQRLKDRRRDWRKAENLSVDDEAVRRVALAREEKAAADKHLAEIEKNTADLAAKIDELLSVKG